MIDVLVGLGAAFTIISSIAYPGICRVDPKALGAFLRFMAWVTVVRIVLWSFLLPSPELDDGVMSSLSYLRMLTVFWEDALFTLPILILSRYTNSKTTIAIALSVSAVCFALGHMAYGLPWAMITLLYVPFISYRYGKKYGLGTVMIGHILYDLVTLASFVLLR